MVMKKLIGLLIILGFCGVSQASDYAVKYPTKTALRVTVPADLNAYALTKDALLLDQSTPQTVINDKPIFAEGVAIGTSNKYLKMINSNTVGLYVNNVLTQDWQVVPTGAGTAMGVLGLTYSS
jgi:hypothetical protein